jgi:excisionase family DNA binding protein
MPGRIQDRQKFTTGQVARLIDASRNTVVRFIQEGSIRARRTAGGWYVIPRAELVQFLWDLTFSKSTPPRIWRAATAAYEILTQPAPPRKSK